MNRLLKPESRLRGCLRTQVLAMVIVVVALIQLAIHTLTFMTWEVGTNLLIGPGLMILLSGPLALITVALVLFWLYLNVDDLGREIFTVAAIGLCLFINVAVALCILDFHDGYRMYPASGGDAPDCLIPHP
ncbi:MAG: hypothetical protein AAGM22_10770 [Acidobacteriota bacterium]